MSKPRRTSIDLICDIFADLAPEQQDGILITLQALHRQAKRRRSPPQPNGTLPIIEEPEAESDLERDRR